VHLLIYLVAVLTSSDLFYEYDMVRFGARSRRYSRRFYRRRPYVSRPIRSYVRRVVASNIENKRCVTDLSTSYSSISGAWNESNLIRVAQGSDVYARTGRRINVRSIEIKGVLCQGTSGSAADDPYNVVRVILGLYTGPHDVGPLFASSTLTVDSPVSPWNVGGSSTANQRMIRKYWDRYFSFSSPSPRNDSGYVPATIPFRYFKRFVKPMFIQFGDGSANSADKWFWLSMVSDSVAIPNPGVISGYCVLTFEDA